MSGRASAKASAKPTTPRLIEAAIACGESLPVQVSMRSAMGNPSASMASDSSAECRLQMHAADDQPQRQAGRLRDRRQGRFAEAVFCAGAGNDGDGTSGAAPAAVRPHHRSPDWGCSEY